MNEASAWRGGVQNNSRVGCKLTPLGGYAAVCLVLKIEVYDSGQTIEIYSDQCFVLVIHSSEQIMAENHLIVGDDLDLAVQEHPDAGVSRTEVDPNGHSFRHLDQIWNKISN